MLELFDVSYEELKITRSNELYRLRKKTFSGRLGWDVVCNRDMEFDEFDNPATRYILGLCEGHLVCSVRFIGLDQPNMITHTFNSCFGSVCLPDTAIESSRFFVDKDRTRQLLGERYQAAVDAEVISSNSTPSRMAWRALLTPSLMTTLPM
ncbi:hypothetical protein GCM10023078_02430 [Gibbsiella greigii]